MGNSIRRSRSAKQNHGPAFWGPPCAVFLRRQPSQAATPSEACATSTTATGLWQTPRWLSRSPFLPRHASARLSNPSASTSEARTLTSWNSLARPRSMFTYPSSVRTPWVSALPIRRREDTCFRNRCRASAASGRSRLSLTLGVARPTWRASRRCQLSRSSARRASLSSSAPSGCVGRSLCWKPRSSRAPHRGLSRCRLPTETGRSRGSRTARCSCQRQPAGNTR
mmetsp:Transcript_62810/g.149615  ORF Transcript_62810/g.149615 Transcript_62810/m.149615 type:complete len:225 (+) Transcript_62810:300-974(+)